MVAGPLPSESVTTFMWERNGPLMDEGMARVISYCLSGIALAIAALFVYAIFAELPAPKERVEVPVILNVTN